MDLFVEKKFIEKFEKDNHPERYTRIQEIISKIFSRYANIRLFSDTSLSYIEESELLARFSDNNTNNTYDLDFDDFFNGKYIPAPQTIILTEKPRQWFAHLKSQGALCYSYDSYENEIREFINDTHIEVNLADPDNPFDWSIFKYLRKHETFIIITDPYILNENSKQKIKDNLSELLKTNLDIEREYKIFIIADVTGIDKEKIVQKEDLLYQCLEEYQVVIYIISNIKGIGKMRIHDRYFFTNHVIVTCAIGFNLYPKNRELSKITGKSIFDFATYREFRTHFSFLRDYLKRIEKLEVKGYKTNDNGSFKSFFEIADSISP